MNRLAILAVVFSSALALAAPLPAAAAETHSNCVTFDSNGNIVSVVPNCTETMNAHGLSFSFPSANPCTNAPGVLSFSNLNEVMHITVNGAADIWATGTQEANLAFTPLDTSQPSFSGHFASWFGVSLNRTNAVIHDIFNATATASNGSTITAHMIDHISFSASTPPMVNQFSIATLSCG